MSPLVFLVRAGLPEMLRVGASEVVVPEPVLRELEAHGPDDPTVRAIRDMDLDQPGHRAEDRSWDCCPGPWRGGIRGPAAGEVRAQGLAVIDDGEARRCARSLSIPVIVELKVS